MREFGFWVYTGPNTGGCEGYREPEWDALLDDMAAGGMNSLAICVSCKRKGCRSELPYLQNDQDPSNVVIATDNGNVRDAIRRAHARDIKVWIQTIANCYWFEDFDIALPEGASLPSYGSFKYDLDSPTIQERAVEQCEEIVRLFPDMDGFSVEFENHDIFYRHRAAPYNAWAEESGRPSYEELAARPANPRSYPFREIREYTTWQTCELLNRIESVVRDAGFAGELSSICGGNGSVAGTYASQTDYAVFRETAPHWIAIPYEYSRWRGRLASADCCMVEPKRAGITTYFLGRGVMTWGNWVDDWMPVSFEEHWRADFEDALAYGVDGLWMFEADAFTDGPHVDKGWLRKKGLADGTAARRKLIEIAGEVGVPTAIDSGSRP